MQISHALAEIYVSPVWFDRTTFSSCITNIRHEIAIGNYQWWAEIRGSSGSYRHFWVHAHLCADFLNKLLLQRRLLRQIENGPTTFESARVNED